LAEEISGRALDEKELLRRIRSGQSEYFHELVRRCYRPVYLTAFSVLRNEGDAEEITQEAIAKAWAGMSRFRMESRFSTWLTQIALNEARLKLRRDKKYRFRSIDERGENQTGLYVPRELIDWKNIPSHALESKHLRKALLGAFGLLPKIYREIFVLRDVQGLSIKQTARLTGMTEGTVKTRLLRARLQMRDFLSKPTVLQQKELVLLRDVRPIPCSQVWRLVSDFLDDDVTLAIRRQIQSHIAGCRSCKAIVEGVRNVIMLVADPRAFPVPRGFSKRVYRRLRVYLSTAPSHGPRNLRARWKR